MTHPGARLRELLAAPSLLVMPGAYDALSARLIAQAGFDLLSCERLREPSTKFTLRGFARGRPKT